MPAKKLGKDGIFAYDTAATFASPTWRAIKSAIDIMLNQEPYTVDSSDRFGNNELALAIRWKVSASANFIWNGGTAQTLLRTNFLAATARDLLIADGAAGASPKGLRGDWLVKSFNLEFPLLGEQKLAIEIVPHGNYTAGQAVAFATGGSAGTTDTAAVPKLGKDASVNTSGGTPITGIRDFKLGLEWNTTDANDRGCDYDLFLATLMKYSLEVNFIWDSSDANIVAFRTAATTNAKIELYALDGPYATTGSWGLHSDFAVKSFPWNAKLTEGQMYTMTLVPTNIAGATAVLPTFVTI